MFDWLGDIIAGMGEAMTDAFTGLGSEVSKAIWAAMLQWFYETIYGAVADFFSLMNNMGAEIFDLDWVKATIQLFTLFGWALFISGSVVAVFDIALEYRNGKASIQSTAINIFKGFLACSLVGILPVELYRFCVSLQNTFSHDLASLFANGQVADLSALSLMVLTTNFFTGNLGTQVGLMSLLCMIAFAYCVIKIFFQNITRGGILLVQMTVGSLYMFSVPRGYVDGFNQWMKQVAALCLTAFMQTTLLYLGLLTFSTNMLLGLGIMLAANQVPQIAQQFGLEGSVGNVTTVIHMTSNAVSVARSLLRPR